MVRARSASQPPNASAPTSRQNGHESNGSPQPHRRFSSTPRSQRSRISPTEKEPSAWPRSRSRSVLPLRPQPPMYRPGTDRRPRGASMVRSTRRTWRPCRGRHRLSRARRSRVNHRAPCARASRAPAHRPLPRYSPPPRACVRNALVVIDVLTERMPPGNYDRFRARAHAVDDGSGPP